ncbi:MAG: LysR family transcriptional regulator [Sandaracinus sp.]|nr:LysR family transcriptional regulator [Myxococcales bacterium]MCB9632890.1 LysR family transcriptional regulator [Sandaracinus sp.]
MNLSNVDLDALHVLHVVLREGSVTQAARALHRTSPAVSNTLARLRELFGDPLLVRRGRGLVPTPRAEELAPVLAATFDRLERALLPSEPPERTERTMCLALTDADQLADGPTLARAFTTAFPRAHLEIVSVDVLIASGGLAGGRVDVAIGPPSPTPEPGHHARSLREERSTWVVRRDHPRVGRRLGRRAFVSERHVDIHLALGRGGRGHRAAEDAFASFGLTRDIAVTVPSFVAAAELVATSDWITGMPRRLAQALAPRLGLRLVSGPIPPMCFEMQMHWHERTERDPIARRFREIVYEASVG